MDEKFKAIISMLNLLYHIKNSGLPLEKLSQKTGIPQDRLESLSKGFSEPTMSDVRKFAKALKLSIDFLVSDNEQFQEINLLFRKAIKNDKDKAVADKFSYLIGNTFSILSNSGAGLEWLQNFPRVDNTYKNAEKLATFFRKLFFSDDQIGPVISLPHILAEELGCIVYVTDLGKDVDGASAIVNNTPFIFISPRFEPRMLFTLAHELGHILAHHQLNENFAAFDKSISALKASNFKEESFSNAFASCLLLPIEGVGITLKKIRERFNNTGDLGDIEIIFLARIYGVSFEVAAKRCEDLDLLPSGGAFSLYETVTSNHGSPEIRARQLGIEERGKLLFPKVSSNLIYSAIQKINQGELSLGKASEILSIPITEIMRRHSLHSIREQ